MSVQFDHLAHDQFVHDHGERVQWYQAHKCPCSVVGDPNRANPNCQACLGGGFIYDAPIELTVILTGHRTEKALVAAGIMQPGDMVLGCSPLDTNLIGDYDIIRITWAEGQPFDGQVIKRAIDASLGDSDQLLYTAKRILSCFRVDPVTDAVITYAENTDFTVVGKLITWMPSPAARPPDGSFYSLHYDVASYDWSAFFTPMQRFDQHVRLGRRVLLKKRAPARLPT